jgi:hypothetical protein
VTVESNHSTQEVATCALSSFSLDAKCEIWIYKEFYSWLNILRRIPDGSLEQKIRFLVFNIALKKANWAWEILIRLNLLSLLFRIYWRLLGASKHIAFSQRSSVHTLKAAHGSEGM